MDSLFVQFRETLEVRNSLLHRRHGETLEVPRRNLFTTWLRVRVRVRVRRWVSPFPVSN